MNINDDFTQWWTGRAELARSEAAVDPYSIPGASRIGPVPTRMRGQGYAQYSAERERINPFNDGSTLTMGLADKPMPLSHWASEGRLRPQAGATHAINYPAQPTTSWRLGEPKGVKIGDHPSPERARAPTDMHFWKHGDAGHLILTDDSTVEAKSVPSPPPHTRKGGVGRRYDPTINPYNDGSQIKANAMFQDRLDRHHWNKEAYRLEGGTSLTVVPVSKADHEALLRAECKPEVPARVPVDPRIVAVAGVPLAETAQRDMARPRRSFTDLTVCEDDQSWAARNAAAARRFEEQPQQNKPTEWRGGDALPFRIDHSEARAHEHILDPNHSAWRMGDEQPFRVDGSVPQHADRAFERATLGAEAPYAAASVNARRHTDFVFHQRPELTGARRLLENRTKDYNEAFLHGDGLSRQLPVSDVMQQGFSWAEMERRGMLEPRRSASEAHLPTRYPLY